MRTRFEEPWDHTLVEGDDGVQVLVVVAGSVGLYDVEVELDEAERAEVDARGHEAVRALAARVRHTPGKYQHRAPGFRILRASAHRRMPWANGLGTTAEIAVAPEGRADWSWRLSLADVAADGPFSALPGIDRHLLVARGAGMAITIDLGPEHTMTTASPTLAFAGESRTSCRLLEGPISDLNLMVRRGRGVGELRSVRLPEAAAFVPSADDVVLLVLEGALDFGSETLGPLDALRIGSRRRTLVARPACTVAVASFRPD